MGAATFRTTTLSIKTLSNVAIKTLLTLMTLSINTLKITLSINRLKIKLSTSTLSKIQTFSIKTLTTLIITILVKMSFNTQLNYT